MAKLRMAAMVDSAAGRYGGVVVARGRSGPVLQRLPQYKRPISPAQAESMARLKAAVGVWNGLSADQAEAWRQYAEGLVRHNTLTGEAYSPIAYNAFSMLATKFLQLNPGGAVPVVPPVGSFTGDSVTVTAGPVAGGVRFSADRPNAPEVVTELLVQRLANVRRKPGKDYAHAAFFAFAPGSLTVEVPLAPGVYALAVRFVQSSSGRSWLLTRLPGRVEVGD